MKMHVIIYCVEFPSLLQMCLIQPHVLRVLLSYCTLSIERLKQRSAHHITFRSYIQDVWSTSTSLEEPLQGHAVQTDHCTIYSIAIARKQLTCTQFQV